jgi:hypothetical protein
MKNILVCRDCEMEIDRNEAFLTNSLDFSCENCFEEWDMEDRLLDDYLYEI